MSKKTQPQIGTIKFPVNENFMPWLHQITTLGYEKDIIIPSSHCELFKDYYREGKTAEQALQAFIKLLENESQKNA